MPSRFVGDSVESTWAIEFDIDHNGNPSTGWVHPNLLTTKPTVAIEDKENTSIPVGFYLAQNYPNPFNPLTTIQFTIPFVETHRNASLLQLVVYDIAGKEIATLIDNVNSSGSYKVEWNALGYPSGIYFYQLVANDQIIATKKMLYIK